jgi:hypothetical protein
MGGEMNLRTPLAFFSVCALVRFRDRLREGKPQTMATMVATPRMPGVGVAGVALALPRCPEDKEKQDRQR